MSVASDDSGDECWYNEAEEAPVSRLSKDLEDFRSAWQTELREKRMGIFRPSSGSKKTANDNPSAALEKAKKLFLLGYSAEKDGKLADAIEYYRHAVLIDPSIEINVGDDLRAYRMSLSKNNADRDTHERNLQLTTSPTPEAACNVIPETVIYKDHEQIGYHISILPQELLLYLFRWVVGNQMDIRMLEQLSMTCRAFYFLARDTELWRLICFRTFGRTFLFAPELTAKCLTWRDIYLTVPHLHFNGCYISRVVYHRRGDISLDCAYQPWHSVEYYRYFRFFADGTVLTLTTPDDPVTSLPKLRYRNSKFLNVIQGIYRVSGTELNIILEKTSLAEQPQYRARHEKTSQSMATRVTYFMSCELRSRRYRSYMIWKSYQVVSRLPGGSESSNDFDCLSANGRQSFPPLFFSRVKSFSATSEAVLA